MIEYIQVVVVVIVEQKIEWEYKYTPWKENKKKKKERKISKRKIADFRFTVYGGLPLINSQQQKCLNIDCMEK